MNPAKPLKIRENEWTKEPKLQRISSQPRYDHFDISPSMLNPVLEYNDYSIFHRTGRPVMSCCGSRNFSLAVRFAKFRPLPLLFAPFIRHRRRSQTSPLRYLSVDAFELYHIRRRNATPFSKKIVKQDGSTPVLPHRLLTFLFSASRVRPFPDARPAPAKYRSPRRSPSASFP